MKKENPFCAEKFDFLQFFKYKIKTFLFQKVVVYYTCFLRIHNIKKSNLHLLTSELILPYPDFRIDFTLETVASNKVKVAILSEVNDGKERICTGAS